MNYCRYAIYHAPRPGPLHDAASRWLGRDAGLGWAMEHPDLEGLEATFEALTASPRRYGLHATLKPPFRLAGGKDEAGLRAALERAAATLQPMDLGRLSVASLGRFLALVPDEAPRALSAFVAEVVRRFDDFRAPPPPEETTRRRAGGLSERQEALLAEWGYPYVMEEFRFHMTLTGRLDSAALPQVRAAAEAWFDPLLNTSATLADLCLFGEEGDSSLFRLIARYPLLG